MTVTCCTVDIAHVHSSQRLVQSLVAGVTSERRWQFQPIA